MARTAKRDNFLAQDTIEVIHQQTTIIMMNFLTIKRKLIFIYLVYIIAILAMLAIVGYSGYIIGAVIDINSLVPMQDKKEDDESQPIIIINGPPPMRRSIIHDRSKKDSIMIDGYSFNDKEGNEDDIRCLFNNNHLSISSRGGGKG